MFYVFYVILSWGYFYENGLTYFKSTGCVKFLPLTLKQSQATVVIQPANRKIFMSGAE